MVDLRPYIHPEHYHRGIRLLLRAYETSRDALDAQMVDATEEAELHRRAAETNGETIEYNDSYVVITRTDSLGLQLAAARDAASEARAAFVIALFHHWERSVGRWTGRHLSNFKEQVKAVEKIGYPLDPGLEAVQCLANLLKHDSEKWGERARILWPGLFPRHVATWPGSGGWYDVIVLRDDHVETVADILRASGPAAMS